MKFSVLTAFSLVSSVLANYASDCDPTDGSCSADTGLTEDLDIDFKTKSSYFDSLYGADRTNYTEDGLVEWFQTHGDGPSLRSNFYVYYGKIEITCKTPNGQGIISNFFMQSDTGDEIDVEWISSYPTQVTTNYFGKGVTGDYDRGTVYTTNNNLNESYHTYVIDWKEDSTTWSYDGTVIRTLKKSDVATDGEHDYPASPMRIFIGMWAGGDSASAGTVQWAGGATDLSGVPYIYHVKNVKITNYNKAGSYSYSDKSGTKIALGSASSTSSTSSTSKSSTSASATTTKSSASASTTSSSSVASSTVVSSSSTGYNNGTAAVTSAASVATTAVTSATSVATSAVTSASSEASAVTSATSVATSAVTSASSEASAVTSASSEASAVTSATSVATSAVTSATSEASAVTSAATTEAAAAATESSAAATTSEAAVETDESLAAASATTAAEETSAATSAVADESSAVAATEAAYESSAAATTDAADATADATAVTSAAADSYTSASDDSYESYTYPTLSVSSVATLDSNSSISAANTSNVTIQYDSAGVAIRSLPVALLTLIVSSILFL